MTDHSPSGVWRGVCCVVCGVRCVVCGGVRGGVWCGVVCGVLCVVCGVWVCGVRRVVCGIWCVVCGVWSVVCGLRCAVHLLMFRYMFISVTLCRMLQASAIPLNPKIH